MRRLQQFALFGLTLFVGIAYGWTRLRSELGGASWPDSQEIPLPPELGSGLSHPVSPKMLTASHELIEHEAAAFKCPATDGVTYVLSDLIRRGPVVLTFTKIGCPCSESAQPLFEQVAAAYPRATVLGVVNGDTGPAELWCRHIGASYPHLLDPGLEIVRAYGVENSAYVVLIDGRGRIVEHWPGISQEMLRDLGARLARISSSPEKSLDVTEAPDQLYTGCPFDL